MQGQVHVAVQKLLAANAGEVGSITTTGHSLGGALASMCAFDIAWSGINKDGDQQWGDYIPVTAFTFEAPRVGMSSVRSMTFSRANTTVPRSLSLRANQAHMCIGQWTAQELPVPLLH